MNIIKQHIVITGGTSGIGYQLVQQLHGHNTVIVLARSAQKLEQLKNNFPSIITYSLDLTDLSQLDDTIKTITARFHAIDILINNAASQQPACFLDAHFNLAEIHQEITLNFTSICHLIYGLLPALLKTTPSVILNINSGLALAPKTTAAVYCGTKGALNIFSQSLGYQLEHTNIQVQQAFLPLVDTAMTHNRGNNKMSAEAAAQHIINGLVCGYKNNDIGKVKMLRLLMRLSPSLARRLLKKH